VSSSSAGTLLTTSVEVRKSSTVLLHLPYSGRTENTVLFEEPETLNAELLQEAEEVAKTEAEKVQP